MPVTRSTRQRDKVLCSCSQNSAATPADSSKNARSPLVPKASRLFQVDYQEASDDEQEHHAKGRTIDYRALSAQILNASLPRASCIGAE